MVSALIQLPFGLSHRTPGSEHLAWAAPGLHAKRELMKLCARIGYTPH